MSAARYRELLEAYAVIATVGRTHRQRRAAQRAYAMVAGALAMELLR